MMLRIVLISVLFISVRAQAQRSDRAFEFFANQSNCARSLGGWKCLELDLSSELLEENDSTKQYEYSWSFGDGTRLKGAKIEHCYESFGNYQVAMDLLDLETNTVIRNELSAVVYLYPEIHPSIKVHTEGQLPTNIELSFDDNDTDEFSPDRVFWSIDGEYYEGQSVVHSFPVAGVYRVEMGVEKDMGFLGTVSACASRDITITESDVWTRSILASLSEARDKSQSGPYSRDEVFCVLRNLSTGKHSGIRPVNLMMRQSSIGEETDYEVVAFSGSHFTGSKKFTTKGHRGKDMYLALRDTMSSLFQEPLNEIPSVYFENATSPVDTSAVRRIAELLTIHSSFTVEVGSYLHTGSRLSKGIETSIARSSAVKEVLVRYGIAPDRVSIALPEYNRSLVNTCSALNECDWENAALNGKTEIKITGAL